MQYQSEQQAFFRELTKSAFFIYGVTWFVLFLLETLKAGIVTNYLSLTHSFLPFVLLGVLWLVLLPTDDLSTSQNSQRPFPIGLLSSLSILLAVFLLVVIEGSIFLTLMSIFATLAALWGGVYSFWNQSDL